MSAKLKVVKPEVSDDVLAELMLELAREDEDSLQRLCQAVVAHEWAAAEKLAKELIAND